MTITELIGAVFFGALTIAFLAVVGTKFINHFDDKEESELDKEYMMEMMEDLYK